MHKSDVKTENEACFEVSYHLMNKISLNELKCLLVLSSLNEGYPGVKILF